MNLSQILLQYIVEMSMFFANGRIVTLILNDHTLKEQLEIMATARTYYHPSRFLSLRNMLKTCDRLIILNFAKWSTLVVVVARGS